ncbi:MAG TPA: HepT-like ribonuclease domain-containing protein [Candidatus Paceibacterota bacterium]
MKDDSVYTKQILESIGKIESFIGEVSKKISAKTKKLIDLPWREIAGFRNMAVHNYFDIDLDIVWDTVTKDILILKERLGN